MRKILEAALWLGAALGLAIYVVLSGLAWIYEEVMKMGCKKGGGKKK